MTDTKVNVAKPSQNFNQNYRAIFVLNYQNYMGIFVLNYQNYRGIFCFELSELQGYFCFEPTQKLQMLLANKGFANVCLLVFFEI